MRIQPGSPDSLRQPSSPAGPQAQGVGFRGLLARRIADAAAGWQRALGAEPQWSAAPVLAAPLRPPGLEGEGPESARVELHRIASDAPPSAGPAAARLREMLQARLGLEEKMTVRMTGRKG